MLIKKTALYAAALLPIAVAPAMGQDASAFFKGREVKLVVGTSAGGGYDTYARLVAHFQVESAIAVEEFGEGSLQAGGQ